MPIRKAFTLIRKGWHILLRRLRSQGLLTTLVWLYGRGLPFITGKPLLRFSQITPQLYVGPQYRLAGKRLLEENGISACVNMRIERDDAALGLALAQYLHLPTVDDDAPSMEHLEEGIEFIRGIIDTGGKVYIHCGAGVGRAPSMAAAYLMAEGHSLDKALSMIRETRPFISITPPQMEQLEKFEVRLRENGTGR